MLLLLFLFFVQTAAVSAALQSIWAGLTIYPNVKATAQAGAQARVSPQARQPIAFTC
jgi:hypothetical protein